ncbi:hypothetical protein ACFQZC_10800 [Streptacidiphilus monticola]
MHGLLAGQVAVHEVEEGAGASSPSRTRSRASVHSTARADSSGTSASAAVTACHDFSSRRVLA